MAARERIQRDSHNNKSCVFKTLENSQRDVY